MQVINLGVCGGGSGAGGGTGGEALWAILLANDIVDQTRVETELPAARAAPDG
tara:strand:+ start:322 stop:480 length:159 start_codon:yes stop_codon:yes gene_type:complete